VSACRSCNAPIFWVETEAKENKPGRKMPLDAAPHDTAKPAVTPDGNIVLVGQTGDGTPIARYVGKGKGRHVSHFSSCPNAKRHRQT
jgi:hypothetical protein